MVVVVLVVVGGFRCEEGTFASPQGSDRSRDVYEVDVYEWECGGLGWGGVGVGVGKVGFCLCGMLHGRRTF